MSHAPAASVPAASTAALPRAAGTGAGSAAEESVSPRVSSGDDRLTLMLKHLMGGALAGLLAKSIIAPLDRVKILLQINMPGFHGRGVLGAMSAIYQREGLRGLWRGNSATALRVVPYAAIQVGAGGSSGPVGGPSCPPDSQRCGVEGGDPLLGNNVGIAPLTLAPFSMCGPPTA